MTPSFSPTAYGYCALDLTLRESLERNDVSNGIAIARAAERVMARGQAGGTWGLSNLTFVFKLSVCSEICLSDP